MAYADIGMMERVIQNLLENAIKFTPENGMIDLQLNKENDYITVSIRDSGEGISDLELPNIFDRYKRGSRTGIKGNEGLGLGLAIVKKILEVHNIEIKVESKKDIETTFYFKVPLYKSSKVINSNKEIKTL